MEEISPSIPSVYQSNMPLSLCLVISLGNIFFDLKYVLSRTKMCSFSMFHQFHNHSIHHRIRGLEFVGFVVGPIWPVRLSHKVKSRQDLTRYKQCIKSKWVELNHAGTYIIYMQGYVFLKLYWNGCYATRGTLFGEPMGHSRRLQRPLCYAL